jgi:hypothetical protein
MSNGIKLVTAALVAAAVAVPVANAESMSRPSHLGAGIGVNRVDANQSMHLGNGIGVSRLHANESMHLLHEAAIGVSIGYAIGV